MAIFDTLKSLVNNLVNERNAIHNNVFTSTGRLNVAIIRDLIKTGLYRRIINLKSGHAMKSGFNFDDDKSQEFYKSIEAEVKVAVRSMVGYGRGVIVIITPMQPLSEPLGLGDIQSKKLRLRAFANDIVTATATSFNVIDDMYMKPIYYQIREQRVHHSRVIDFRYEQPPELELPEYFYGGMSEAELIYPQLIADGVTERAIPALLEKSSTLFYKIKGFKEALESNKHQLIVRLISELESKRSIFGGAIIDGDDDVNVQNQTLTGLIDSDLITLRRIAMVTAIPLTILLGEGAKGLNTSNETEKQVFNEMIETLQTEFILKPLGDLMELFSHKRPSILVGQNISPTDKMKFESMVIDNAMKLYNMGADPDIYLNENGIINIDEDFT